MLLISLYGLVTQVKLGQMALKEIRKEIAYPYNLPIRPWPFAFNRLLWTCDSRKIGQIALKEIRKKIAYPNDLPIRPWPLAFNQLLWPCYSSQMRPNCVPL